MPPSFLAPPGRNALVQSELGRRSVAASAVHDAISLSDSMPGIRAVAGGAKRRLAVRAVKVLRRWMPFSSRDVVAREGGHGLEPSVRLLAGLSHDLLTPITRMKLRAEMLGAHAIRQKLFNDLDEMESLIRDVLDYAGSTGRSAERCGELEIASFLESIAADYQDMGKDVAAVDTAAGAILTRPRVLRRILTNLVDNALKFAGAAEIVTDMRANAFLTISVLDRGPGIPQEQLAAVLKPFFRLPRNKPTAPGLGLGLAIASNLVCTLNGSLALRNREGGGLRAELRLPVCGGPIHAE